jgi:cyclopropane fatty-acyl-phospholipid synthase-like methyltransferase
MIMSATPEEFLHLREYIRASQELVGWITGARVFALLSGAIDSGVLDALCTRSTAGQIAEVTGIDKQHVVDLCLALEVHGIVQRDGESYELTPDYALLSSPTAAIPLSNVIRQAMVTIRALQTIAPADVPYTATPTENILAMAAGAGVSALSSSPHVGQATMAKVMPEVEALWQAGARHLEVGCGVGNSLFGTVTTYPKVTAVGIEIEELTAAEAERRAGVLGVSDRVEVRRMDACELQDEDAFDTIQWSQFFFPTATRAVVLRAMHRALKPGGYLFMPWLGSASEDMSPSRSETLRTALRAMRSGGMLFLSYLNDFLGDTPRRRKKERRSAALNRLLFTQWGVPVRAVEELKPEIENSGFTVIRSAHLPVSQFVLTRGMLLAQLKAG